MKQLNLVVMLISICAVSLFAVKRYDVKNGMVEYKIEAHGQVMGTKTEVSGVSYLYFKDYGNINVNKERITQTIMGNKNVSDDFVKFDGEDIYSVDYDKKIVLKHKLGKKLKDLAALSANDENLKKMGGKKIGSDTISGYKCDIWDISNAKMCVYKGVPLKVESEMMGLKHTQIAKDAKFDTKIDEANFKLPDFPIKTKEDIMGDVKKQMQEQMKNLSPEEKKQMQEMMKNLNKMFE